MSTLPLLTAEELKIVQDCVKGKVTFLWSGTFNFNGRLLSYHWVSSKHNASQVSLWLHVSFDLLHHNQVIVLRIQQLYSAL